MLYDTGQRSPDFSRLRWPTTLIRHPGHPPPSPGARRCRCACLPLLFACQAALADSAAAAELPGVSTGALLQSLLGLAAVVGLLLLAVFFLRRMNGGQGFGARGPLRIVGGLSIGARERIVVVEVGDTWLLVGTAPGQISTLHTMPKGQLPQGTGQEKPFAQWLKQAGLHNRRPEQ